MTKILALDTSGEACSVALLANGSIEQRFQLAPREHTRLILPMVEELLGEAGLALTGLDALAFGRGPGSFTGLRICAGVVQGLAWGADLPVVPVSSLKAMAHGVEPGRQVLASFDARMSELYFAHYQCHASGPELLGEERLIKPEALFESLAMLQLDNCLALGSGWRYLEDSGVDARKFLRVDTNVQPSAAAIAALAEADLHQGRVVSAEQVEPVYLRDEVTWQKSSVS